MKKSRSAVPHSSQCDNRHGRAVAAPSDRRHSGRNRVFTQALRAAGQSNGKDAGREKGAPAEEARRQAIESVPLGCFATKDEVSNLALFLCTYATAYITGPMCV